MCVNYKALSHKDMVQFFDVDPPQDVEWSHEAYQHYLAPIIRIDESDKQQAIVASYGMIPKQHIPEGMKPFSTMNARSETVGQLKSFKAARNHRQFCLVPMHHFYEPNYESGKHERWAIGMEDELPFAVAGLWRDWKEVDGSISYSFTQLTINADHHPLMKRFHRPEDEKRSLVVIAKEDYDNWLNSESSDEARSFLKPYPAERMKAWAAPKEARAKKKVDQPSLF